MRAWLEILRERHPGSSWVPTADTQMTLTNYANLTTCP
jgi:hypothetical protein